MNKSILALAAAAMVLPTSAVVAENFGSAPTWEFQSKKDRAYERGYQAGRRESQAVNSNTRVWRGKDGRNYCRRSDGTTGLLIGAAAGGVAGNVIAGRGDKTVGTIIGAAGGALIGRHVDRRNARCR